MIIDIVFVFLMILAVVKGFKNGFIVAIFSFLGVIIGLAAAMKLSTVVAGWLQESTHISAAWLPFISFLLIMIGVILLVRLGAKLIQSVMELALLGWLNKLSGILLYVALYTTIFSVCLFYMEKIHWIKPDTFITSKTFAFIQPWGPKAIEFFAKVIPFFQGMFDELSKYFEEVHQRIK